MEFSLSLSEYTSVVSQETSSWTETPTPMLDVGEEFAIFGVDQDEACHSPIGSGVPSLVNEQLLFTSLVWWIDGM